MAITRDPLCGWVHDPVTVFVTMGLERLRTTMMSSLSLGVMWLAEGSTMDIWVKRVNKKTSMHLLAPLNCCRDLLPKAHTSLEQGFSCLKPEQLGCAWKNTQIYTSPHSTCLCHLCQLCMVNRLVLSNNKILYLHSQTFWLHQNSFVTVCKPGGIQIRKRSDTKYWQLIKLTRTNAPMLPQRLRLCNLTKLSWIVRSPRLKVNKNRDAKCNK